MSSLGNLSPRGFLIPLLLLVAMAWATTSDAIQLGLTWEDTSTNEDGFKIMRKTGTTGTLAQVAAVGANITAYADPTPLDGTTYCYLVRAFNVVGDSADSNEACAIAIKPFILTVATAGSGQGTVNSLPAGIACEGDCSEPYPSGTTVTLTASATAGSTFTGWSGGGCNGTGPCAVTLSANTSATATFSKLMHVKIGFP